MPYAPADGARIYYEDTGTGTPVIFVHEFGADFRTWEWTGWTTPRYHQRLKPVYDSLKAVWSRP